MRKRRNADEIARQLEEFDREPARGPPIADIRREAGIAQTTYYRWRQRNDPEEAGADRRVRELEVEVERLKRSSPS